jgi:hypothetical protein
MSEEAADRMQKIAESARKQRDMLAKELIAKDSYIEALEKALRIVASGVGNHQEIARAALAPEQDK